LRDYDEGDALARLRVRWDEVDQSFGLLSQVCAGLARVAAGEGPLVAPCDPAGGRATGWAEAPQGEVLYDVTVAGGRVARGRPRSASFHNLVLMHDVFAGDILTDFPFIEASFGLSYAGVAQ
jgi:Ni,Fe-hydrogenase III large subunit